MHPRTRTTNRVRQALLAAIVAGAAANAFAQTSASAAAPGLREIFEAAWSRQPEAQALQARRDAAQAQRRAAEAWTPEPPALEASHKTDRLTRNDGTRELEVGIAVPLWLPGERRGAGALADAELAATGSRAVAARLRLAAAVRDAWWNWQRAIVETEIARGQLDNARRIASDVSKRAKAGELARADQNQAEGAVAAAEAGLAAAEATTTATLQQLKAIAGLSSAVAPATAAQAEPEPPAGELQTHPALAELQDRATIAERYAVYSRPVQTPEIRNGEHGLVRVRHHRLNDRMHARDPVVLDDDMGVGRVPAKHMSPGELVSRAGIGARPNHDRHLVAEVCQPDSLRRGDDIHRRVDRALR